jgi:hypothetical protein
MCVAKYVDGSCCMMRENAAHEAAMLRLVQVIVWSGSMNAVENREHYAIVTVVANDAFVDVDVDVGG